MFGFAAVGIRRINPADRALHAGLHYWKIDRSRLGRRCECDLEPFGVDAGIKRSAGEGDHTIFCFARPPGFFYGGCIGDRRRDFERKVYGRRSVTAMGRSERYGCALASLNSRWI